MQGGGCPCDATEGVPAPSLFSRDTIAISLPLTIGVKWNVTLLSPGVLSSAPGTWAGVKRVVMGTCVRVTEGSEF